MTVAAQGYLIFRIGREWYGVPVGAVIEVLHMVALNEIAEADILGVMTLREMVIPVVDLRRRFGLAGEYRLDTPIIAVRTRRGSVGLVVDDADDVVYVEQVTPYRAGCVSGAARLQNRMIFVIDLEAIEVEGIHE